MTDTDPVHFELAWAPHGYDSLAANSVGEWRVIELPPGSPAGIIWTDGSSAAGFVPLDSERFPNSSLASTTLPGMFSVAAASGLTAKQAYETVSAYAPLAVSDECRGKLGNVVALAQNPDTKLPDCSPVKDAITAAAPPEEVRQPEDSGESVENESIFAALDDSGTLLELGLSDASGVYIRSNGVWFKVPDSADTLDGKVWQDVTPAAVEVYDTAERSGKTPTTADLQKFFVNASD